MSTTCSGISRKRGRSLKRVIAKRPVPTRSSAASLSKTMTVEGGSQRSRRLRGYYRRWGLMALHTPTRLRGAHRRGGPTRYSPPPRSRARRAIAARSTPRTPTSATRSLRRASWASTRTPRTPSSAWWRSRARRRSSATWWRLGYCRLGATRKRSRGWALTIGPRSTQSRASPLTNCASSSRPTPLSWAKRC